MQERRFARSFGGFFGDRFGADHRFEDGDPPRRFTVLLAGFVEVAGGGVDGDAADVRPVGRHFVGREVREAHRFARAGGVVLDDFEFASATEQGAVARVDRKQGGSPARFDYILLLAAGAVELDQFTVSVVEEEAVGRSDTSGKVCRAFDGEAGDGFGFEGGVRTRQVLVDFVVGRVGDVDRAGRVDGEASGRAEGLCLAAVFDRRGHAGARAGVDPASELGPVDEAEGVAEGDVGACPRRGR